MSMVRLEESLRRLGEVKAPARLAEMVLDRFAVMDTPLGPFFVAWNRDGVSAVYEGRHGEESFQSWFDDRYRRPLVRSEAAPPASVLRRFDMRGVAPFQRLVLEKTSQIPRGEVRTYTWVAKEIGHPKAVRAVGTALATNPMPILIPCHRVVRSDGVIGNYGAGGPVAKRRILDAEGVGVGELEKLAQRGIRYLGSDSTHIFCMPTCRHARRVMERHEVQFRSEEEAFANGYRPCKVCRPVGVAAA
jgi:O-6-methylguanine DNA methyltransferase